MAIRSDELHQLIESTDTRSGRTFDACIQALIILSLVCLAVETLPGITPQQQAILDLIETVLIVIFTVEYLVRFYVSRAKYAFSFFGIVDLLSVLPFYLALGVDMQHLRAFRFLRLIRILKLARYSGATRRLHRALIIAREEIVLYLILTLILFYLAAAGIYFFEHEAQPEAFASIFHSIYWAAISISSVGYGDMSPITVGGKIFTCLIVLIGLGIVAAPAALFASALTAARDMEDK